MLKFVKYDSGLFFIITLIFLCLLPFFFLHQGILSIDTGREFYLAQQVVNGEILYKNIFNIYAPFSYQFNAILFTLFGQKINTLYIAGIINSYIIVITLYFISKQILNKYFAFLTSSLTIFSLVFTTFLFNSNITYSYGLSYALSSFLLSLLFLLMYLKTDNKKMAYFACLFAGLSIINKYEFILYCFVLFFILVKQLSPKEKIKSLICFLAFPLLSFQVLFLQGLNLTELKTASIYMLRMFSAPTLHLFFFNVQNIFRFLNKPVFLLLGLLPFINLIMFICLYKKIINNKILFTFSLSAILASIKFIMFLNSEHMGAFVLPIVILNTLVLLKQTKITSNIQYLILIALILFFADKDFSSLSERNYLLETEKGNIYTYKKDGMPIKNISEYIINNTQKADTVLVLPEGAMINFITGRKSDNHYHSLIPLYYLDILKEKNILTHFEENKPEYIVITPLSTIEYGYKTFCDYAQNFCEMIENNYSLVQEINRNKIYKRKNI